MKEYRPIFISLFKFFSVYLVLTALYYWYLTYYQNELKTCDEFTYRVAKQSSCLLNCIGIPSQAKHIDQENYMRFYVNNNFISIVNEGCNTLSIIILYISFIIAFANSLRKTCIYLIITVLLIYFTNIIRISFINYIFYYYPEYGKFSHDYLFPTVIYGLIMVLWIVWIKYFIFKKNK
ncbi:exosortase family protein XrtF [Apibacter mensalis]|uniref:Exosortase family protein XrtF n=1 Tax=Apibacter mensalis TaxID=1586267 RepID=A0A0X3AMV9_9FLAO|nr:exosortase family protein XrtF [Apibacter mensalis]CVK15721.1 exosortase family protein XrtF [Apibacter mensalis]